MQSTVREDELKLRKKRRQKMEADRKRERRLAEVEKLSSIHIINSRAELLSEMEKIEGVGKGKKIGTFEGPSEGQK